ncbi:MAG TPA: DUF262 domain-containing protein [Flavobacterium sp.]|nr:DUF262 domain-containing protein [Flavobacterium sp.]
MIKYSVRSRQLVDIVSEIKRNKLVLSPPFQRNLVWRTVHKIDFIKTILLGFPFPQIFLAKGELNAEELTTTSVVVDGQQRMNAILEYIDNEYDVDGVFYNELEKPVRDEFLKYEIAIIELDMEADDPNIIDLFQRLNRTFYSLTKIEKLATEYASSELMQVAKLITDEIELSEAENVKDFNIAPEFRKWTKSVKYDSIVALITKNDIFTAYEITRKVPLMITLNVLGTIELGFINRNIKDSMLDDYKDNFESKTEAVTKLNKAAEYFISLKLKKSGMWFNKANFFSLLIFFYNNLDHLEEGNSDIIKSRLTQFEGSVPEDYALAAKEAVNNKKERVLRNKIIEELLLQ